MLSTDGGRTLRESNVGFANRNFTVLTAARGALYAGSAFEPGSGGVYRTDNLGLRWQRTGGEPAGQEIRIMAAAPDQPGTLFAAGYHGLLKSKDAGKTWTESASPPATTNINSLLALPHETLLAATDHGLFRSSDGGDWVAAATGGAGAVSSLELSGDHTVAALGAHGAFASEDAGVTWTACGEPSASTVWYGLAFDQGAAHAALAATSGGLFRSADGCRTWIKVGGGLAADTVSVVLFHPTRAGEAFAAQDGRVFRSTDGGQNWLPLDDGSDERLWPSALLVLPEAPDRVFALFPRRGVLLRTLEGKAVEVVQFR